MKEFIKSFKIAVLDFFSGKVEDRELISNEKFSTVPTFQIYKDNCIFDKKGNANIEVPTKKVKSERKIIKVKNKPKKVLNITIIHNKKPVTITEFSKISGIPYPVIKYHYYTNKIKTSKELKKHLKPETLEKVKVKL